MMQQHQQQMRIKQQNGPGQQGQYQNPSVIKQFPDQNRGDTKSSDLIDSTSENQELDRELQALLSQKELTTSLAEDLLKQFGSSDELEIKNEPDDITPPQGIIILLLTMCILTFNLIKDLLNINNNKWCSVNHGGP